MCVQATSRILWRRCESPTCHGTMGDHDRFSYCSAYVYQTKNGAEVATHAIAYDADGGTCVDMHTRAWSFPAKRMTPARTDETPNCVGLPRRGALSHHIHTKDLGDTTKSWLSDNKVLSKSWLSSRRCARRAPFHQRRSCSCRHRDRVP